jgi:hypothetical protein
MLQAILEVMLHGAGLVGYYPTVLNGVLLTGRFVTRSSFLDPVFLGVLLMGRFVPERFVPGGLVPGRYTYWNSWK